MLERLWRRKPKPKKKWLAIEGDDDEVHVIPLNDNIDHVAHDCVCGTKTEPVPRADGSIGWLITHNSLDGRERNE